jgi:hypothetical protein
MKIKSILAVSIICMTLTGCLSSKSYVDPMYGGIDYVDIKPVNKQYEAKIDVIFQRNGKHLPSVDAELRSNVERIFRATGVVLPSKSQDGLSIKIVCNNIADISAAKAKGFGTGLTFGAAGTAVSDFYKITIELKQGDTMINKQYDHAIHTTIGNKAAPVSGVEPTSVGNAFSGVIEDAILQFIKELQGNNILTLNGSVWRMQS